MAQMDIFGTSMFNQAVPSTVTTTLVNVVLHTQDQWELWIQQIKQRAADANIWTTIDPDQSTPPKFIQKPTIPRYSDVKTGATRLSELDREEKDDFRSLQETYRVEDTEWVRETSALQSIHQFIRERVSMENQAIINTSTNAYETLKLLKNRLHPSDESSKFEVKRQWHMLPLMNPQNQEWEKYVNTWSNVYRRAKALKLPEVEGKMPHVLFALSIKKLDENWGDQRHSEILASTSLVMDFETLVDSYREYKRQKISFARLHHIQTQENMAFNAEAAAPSFQGQDQQGQQTESSRPKCPCGNTFFRHRIASCWYITKKPKEGWEPKPEITEKVARAMRDPKIRSMVEKEKAAKEAASKARSEKEWGHIRGNEGSAFHVATNQYESLNSFHTITEHKKTGSDCNQKSTEMTKNKSSSIDSVALDETLLAFNTTIDKPYYFTNAWIIDGASNKHVCNSPTRSNFTKTRDTDNRTIKCGRSVYPIECYGTCTIMAKTPNGPKPVTLNDVALCLYFRTNLISAAKMNDRGLHLITFNGGYICSAKNPNTPIYIPQRIRNFWCFEFLPPTRHEFAIHPDGDAFLTTDQRPSKKEVQLTKLLSATTSEDLWHERMGHPGPNTLKHLPDAVLGEVTITSAPTTTKCNTCATSKATQIINRSPFKEHPATHIFMRINYDIVHMSRGYNGDRYISHFSCEYSSFQFIFTHPTKSEASRCCLYVLNMIRTHFGIRVRYFHTDGETSLGKENTANNDFFNSIRERGIIVEISAPRTQDQNGAAEIHGKHLLVRARSIRIHSRQPYDLWPEHVRCACVLSNRTPMEKLQWKTPFEIVYGRKPTIHYLVSPGSRAYVLNKSIPKNLKTDPRAFVGYHVGYEGTNIYRIWIPSQKRVVRSRDVHFDEQSHEYNPSERDNSILYPQVIEANIVIRQPPMNSEGLEDLDGTIDLLNNQELEYEEEGRQSVLKQKDVPISSEVPVQLLTPESTPTPIDTESQAAGLRGATLNEKAESGNMQPSTTRRLESGRSGKGRYEYQVTKERTVGVEIDESNVLENRTRGQRRGAAHDATHHTSYDTDVEDGPDQFFTTSLAFHTAVTAARPHRDQLPPPPKNYYDAKKHPLWYSIETAIQKEYASIESQGVFELVAQDSKMKAIPLKWVFAYKFDSEGYMAKVKARLCVRGDKQEVNDLDTYAATLAAETMRFLFAIAAYFDLEMRQFDAVAAFLNCPLDETVHCQPPAGFPSLGQVWKLRRALYGLRRAPYLWHNELSAYLEDLGLKAVPGVNCVHQNDWLVVFFFVDDIICLYRRENQQRFNAFQKHLCTKYKMSTVGEPQWFLGIRVCRNRTARTLTICQESYISKICKRFEKSLFQKEVHTPLPSATLLRNEGQASPSQIMEMQQKVGSINFAAVISRPDIALAASMLSEHLQNPSPKHLEAANYCLSYLHFTQSLAITYSGQNDDSQQFAFANTGHAHISSDASFADDKTTRKSRQGYLFSLFGGPIAWKASKQNTVTTSSTEAELLAVSQVGKELIWWENFFHEINFKLPGKMSICCDNRQTIRLLTNESPQLTTKLRHVDIHHHWLRQEVMKRRIHIEWISTIEMPADGFTKPFTRQKHEHFLRLLNLHPK